MPMTQRSALLRPALVLALVLAVTGCSGIKKMFTVILPLILPTVLASALLVFMRALADFGTPMLIGEGFVVMPVLMMAGGGLRVFAVLIWLICAGVVLEMAGDRIADGAAINGAMILLALGGWLLAVAAQLFEPRRAGSADRSSA